MAWERVNCDKCGAEYKVQMYGPNKTRQWKIDNWRGICDECKERLRSEELEAATAKTSEMDLPELTGTEKQIAWAVKIRVGLLEKIDHEKLSQAEIEAVEKVCAEKTAAGWWIDNRSEYDFSAAIKKTVKLETSPEAVAVNAEKDAAKAEATVYPETPSTGLVTEIAIKEDSIEAIYPEPNEKFRELVKFGLGYTWNG